MKRGFTLIELLAVVVLLGCIFVLAFPKIMNILEKKNIEIEESELEIIYNAGNQYVENNIENKKIGNSYCYTIDFLDKENLIPLDIGNKYDGKSVLIKIGKSTNYTKIVDKCENDDNSNINNDL